MSTLNALKKIGVIAATTTLVACGGGGGGSSAVVQSFTKWSALQPSSTITVSGDSAQGTYSWNSGTNKLTAVTVGTQQSGATFSETLDSSGAIKSINFTTTAGTNQTFTSPTDTFGYLISNSNVRAAVSADGSRYALAGRAAELGFDYQTFGVWVTGAGTGTGTYGAASFGAATPASSVPTSGTATYTGVTGGRYSASDGTYYFTSSALTSNVDFAARTVSFATSSTNQSANLTTGSFAANSALNLTGTLTYSAGSNQFTGAVANSGSTLSGTATGRFYGPAAQEIGGTFGLTGAGLSAYGGGFGAHR